MQNRMSLFYQLLGESSSQKVKIYMLLSIPPNRRRVNSLVLYFGEIIVYK